MGAKIIKICTDSQLIASQGQRRISNKRRTSIRIRRSSSTKVEKLLTQWKSNMFFANTILKLTYSPNWQVPEQKGEPSQTSNKFLQNQVLREVKERSTSKTSTSTRIGEIPLFITSWMHGDLLQDTIEASKIKRKFCSYFIFKNILYKRGFSIPLIKCLGPHMNQKTLCSKPTQM